MHLCGTFNTDTPVFQGALHSYAEIAAATASYKAVVAIEGDVEHERKFGPAFRRALAHKFRPRDEAWGNRIKQV